MRWLNAFERVLVDGDVASKTIAERLDLGEHRLIMGDEGVPAAVPTVLNQRMTDEEFSGEDRIDALQVDLAVRDRWQAVERGPFITHRRAAILVPPGIGVLPTQEVRRARSSHCGLIGATMRARSWFVSTSSAAMIQVGVRFLSAEPPARTKRALRVPR